MSCYSQTCKQRVTGRRFTYRRALNVVNRHRYTDFFNDFDDPLLQRRYGNFKIPQKGQILSRYKRAKDPAPAAAPAPAPAPATAYTTTAAPTRTGDTQAVIPTIAVISAIMLMMPSPNSLPAGQAPASSPQPGTPGGGAIPGGIITPIKAAALVLVPLGLIPVAVFPPFEVEPPFPGTVAVIFSENLNLNKRKKRWISRLFKARQGYASVSKPSLISRIARGLGRVVKRLHKNLACLKPRLAKKFGRTARKQAMYSLGYGIEPKNDYFSDEDENFDVEDMSDCFEGQSGPLFGWSVEVPRINDESCEIDPNSVNSCGALDGSAFGNSNFDSNLNSFSNLDLDPYSNFVDRQVNEEFGSASPPICRIRRSC